MPIKLLTFDLDHTLWAPEPALKRAEAKLYEWFAQHCPAITQLYSPASLVDYRIKLAASRPQLATRVTAFRLECLRLLCLQAGLSREQAKHTADAAFAVFYHERSQLEFYPGARETLEQLSLQYPLIALTNGNADLDIIGVAGLFKGYFNADNVGAAKPAADMFMAALALAGVAASEAVHIGDCPYSDVQAAQQLGMKTVWVNSQAIAWPDELTPADAEVSSVAELPTVLKVFES